MSFAQPLNLNPYLSIRHYLEPNCAGIVQTNNPILEAGRPRSYGPILLTGIYPSLEDMPKLADHLFYFEEGRRDPPKMTAKTWQKTKDQSKLEALAPQPWLLLPLERPWLPDR